MHLSTFLLSAIPLPIRNPGLIVTENPIHVAGLGMQDHRLQGKGAGIIHYYAKPKPTQGL